MQQLLRKKNFGVGGIREVVSTSAAFAALLADGSVMTWGVEDFGGDSSLVAKDLYDIEYLAGSFSAFAAVRKDSRVFIWGGADSIGPTPKTILNVKSLHGCGRGFVCLHSDDSVTIWPQVT